MARCGIDGAERARALLECMCHVRPRTDVTHFSCLVVCWPEELQLDMERKAMQRRALALAPKLATCGEVKSPDRSRSAFA